MTHDNKRQDTTTQFAALDVASDKVIGQCMPRHRHHEWLKFLRWTDAETPKHLEVHLIADDYATHNHTSPGVAHAASTVRRDFHPDLRLLAQPGRALLRSHHPRPHPLRRVKCPTQNRIVELGTCQSSNEELDRGEIEPSLGAGDCRLEVFGEAAVAIEPGQ